MIMKPTHSPLFVSKPCHARRRAGHDAGFSLIELMVAMVAGLILLGGLTSLIIQQSNTRRELEQSARQIENGRYAMQILQDELHHAGFYGHYLPRATASGPPSPCLKTAADLKASFPNSFLYPIQAWDSPAVVPAALSSCGIVDGMHKPGTDILLVRRADTTTTTPTLAAAKEVYLQSTQVSYVFDAVPDAGTPTDLFSLKMKDGVTPADMRKFNVHVYFISPCSTPTGIAGACLATDDGGSPIPTLKRMELALVGGTLDFQLIPLVEGIENMQVDYGIDSGASKDGAPDGSYVSNPDAAQTTDIVSARVHLLVRQLEPTAGYIDTKQYQLGSTAIPAINDGYKRQVFTKLIRADNPSGRREP